MYQFRKMTNEEKQYGRDKAKSFGIRFLGDIDLKKEGIADPKAFICGTNEMKAPLGADIGTIIEKLKKSCALKKGRKLYFEGNGLMYIKLDVRNHMSNEIVVADVYYASL